ncbi:DNA repair protein [Aeromonas phage ZPAH1]|nr:DNA repair protein [Aeromonas phage ZPAH1]
MIFFDENRFMLNDKGVDFNRACSLYILDYAKESGVSDLKGPELLYFVCNMVCELSKEPHHLYKVIAMHENTGITEVRDPDYYTEAYEIFVGEVTMWATTVRLDYRINW